MAVIKLRPERTAPAHLIPAVKPLKILIGSSYRAVVWLTDTAGNRLDLDRYDTAVLTAPGLLLREGNGLALDRRNGQLVIELCADDTAVLSPTLTRYQLALEAEGEHPICHYGLVGPLEIARA